MKPVTIAVSVKNPGFAEDLIRGLSMLDRSYCIEIPGKMDENDTENRWEVLVTDFAGNEGLEARFEPYRVIRADENTCRISQISRRIDEAARNWRDKCSDGQNLFPEEKICSGTDAAKSRVVIFQSFWGGSGTTSMALASGRILSGAYGERVLYLPLNGSDGSLMYRRGMEGEESPEGTCKELFYRMRNDRLLRFGDFISSDYAGLEYLNCNHSSGGTANLKEEEKTELLKGIAAYGEYDWILVDLGAGTLPVSGNVRVLIDNLQDSRTVCRKEKRNRDSLDREVLILIRNRGLENQLMMSNDPDAGETQKEFTMELIDDGESFVPDEQGKVEIVLSKSYASGIKIFSEWLLETVGNSVEMWR